ncbi:MAG: peptidoglycan-binding protein [Bifidobacteriaceae bacterium]|jgi:peptidoglycan hydrolase-like protein with peptidoglycan-binding domain|nr:peptidoglycan-binding protein [Bifidobacteriaceae bacterium]
MVLACGCFVAVWVMGRPIPSSVSAPREPAFATIQEVSFDNNRAAEIEATIVEGYAVLSPGGGSMVTAVSVAVGDTVRAGAQLYSVDGVAVWAVAGVTPLYRALGPGDKGGDVETLQAFLNAYFADDRLAVTGKVDADTGRAIREWQDNTGMEPDGTVDPGQFALIGGEFVAREVSVAVGMPAPALGTVVVAGADRLGSLRVTASEDVTAGEYMFVASGEQLRVQLDGGEWTAANHDEALAFVLAFDAASSGDGSQPGGGTGVGAGDGVRDVVVEGRLALATPINVAGLPPAALVSGSEGGACAWLLREGVWEDETTRAAGDGRSAETLTEMVGGIDVVGISLAGSALVADGTLAGRNVLLDPASFVDTAACR